MTNRPNDVRVSRELAQSIINYMEGSASSQVRAWREQLIEQLAQPADQQGEPAGYRHRVKGHDNWTHTGCKVEFDSRNNDDRFVAERLYRQAQPATAKVVLPDRETLRDVIAAVIGGDAYDCTRVWSSWGVGTMSDDDFLPIVEQEERLYELVDACLDEVVKLNGGQS